MNTQLDKYEKVDDTKVLTNTIPTETIETPYMWIADRHTFEITKRRDNGFFTLSITIQVICVIKLDFAISIIHNSKDRENKKIGDTYPTLRTEDTFKVNETEQENYE